MNAWNFYTAKELKPCGWMRRQLEIQAEGLAGNLDRVWPDVRDSAWIGGEREGWERVPYWLDGFVPLAYLLDDEGMKARAKKYIDAILARRQESGWICPCAEEDIKDYDTWAVQLIAKVLVNYYECSGDERIPDTLYRVMKNYYDLLSAGTIRLFEWGKFRWFEAFVALRFLAARYDEAWIPALARILREEGAVFESFTPLWHTPRNEWRFDTHIVNLCMMLKYEAVSHELLGEEYTDRAEYLRTVLDTYNGMPTGSFTGDECLAGLSPVQGTELCGVVEEMYSYEWLYAVTGDPKWAERLERLAFNALPATISEDMWTHQYLQQSNQIACVRFPKKALFGTNEGEAHLFGLEPQFGCCTANMGQGWPKLALSAFLHREDTVLSALPIPARLDAEGLSVTLETNYPFDNAFTYTVKAERPVTLAVRVPSFAKELSVDGTPIPYTEMLSFAVACGSLLFSLPVPYEKKMYEYEREGVARKFPYSDYELLPTGAWNYGLTDVTFSPVRRPVSDTPFSESAPPVVLKTKGALIPWGYTVGFDTVAAPAPLSRERIGEEKELTLIPYGCAKLRVTELPLV